MEKFTASNGIAVMRNPDDGPDIDYQSWSIGNAREVLLAPHEIDALREFFQAERDEELGRWRWPENPDYVVYLVGDNTVDVLRERSINHAFRGPGRHQSIRREEALGWSNDSAKNFYAAARAYFAAHPEPKPWHAAVEGEVWLLKFSGKEFPAIFQAGRFRDHGGSWEAGDISFARRIWPEGVSDG